jgi:aspartate/methionine/tyrosine aminotransferase
MDLVSASTSHILTVARHAAGMPDVDFLCFGESDQGSPIPARNAMIEAIQAGHTLYPDVRGLPELRDALSAHLTALHAQPVPEHRIQVTASGMAAINVALTAIVRPGDRVVVHTPGWPNPGSAAQLRGAVLQEFALDTRTEGRFALDLERLAATLDGARAFILNSPNNPTGWTATHAELITILEICRRFGVWLIADEVYSRLVFNASGLAPSILDMATPDDRVVVCNSFSKTWAMTGWRLGWMVVPDGTRNLFGDIVELMHSGVAPFAQIGALAAVSDEDFVSRFRAHCLVGRQMVTAALQGLNGIRYAPPDAAFYAWIGVEGLQDSLELALRLLRDHKVALAPGVAFGAAGEGWLRLCFARSPDKLERAMQRLRAGLSHIAG